MREANIRTQFGNISISYQSTEELNEALQNLPDQIQMIQQIANKVSPPLPRTAKPGYESAYRFAPNGELELLYFPKYRNEIVALVLFAYHPEPLSSSDIERFAGIDAVTSKVITLKQNKSFFKKLDDKYTLTLEGLALVQERIGKVLCLEPKKGSEEPK